MPNTTKLTDLNEVLFDQIRRLNNSTLQGKELSTEVQKAQAISNLADTIIKNGELTLKTAMVIQKMGGSNCSIPPMLTDGNELMEEEENAGEV